MAEDAAEDADPAAAEKRDVESAAAEETAVEPAAAWDAEAAWSVARGDMRHGWRSPWRPVQGRDVEEGLPGEEPRQEEVVAGQVVMAMELLMKPVLDEKENMFHQNKRDGTR